MTDNPGTSRLRVGHVDHVGDGPSTCITLYLEVKQLTLPGIYVTESHYVNDVIPVGTRVIQFAVECLPQKSGSSSPPFSSQDKGLKNG